MDFCPNCDCPECCCEQNEMLEFVSNLKSEQRFSEKEKEMFSKIESLVIDHIESIVQD